MGCGEARTAEAAGFARDVAEHAESGAARRDRLFDASLQKVQGRVGTGVAGLRREGLHVGVRDRKVGAAKTVEAQVDRALTGGVRAGEESEPGVERGYQTADDPQPCPRCRGQKHQVVPVSQRGVVVGDREPDGDPAVAQREQTGAARLPHGAAKFDVQEEQVAAAGIRVRVAGSGPQSPCGLLRRWHLPQGGERRLRPCRAPGGDSPDTLPRTQSAVR